MPALLTFATAVVPQLLQMSLGDICYNPIYERKDCMIWASYDLFRGVCVFACASDVHGESMNSKMSTFHSMLYVLCEAASGCKPEKYQSFR